MTNISRVLLRNTAFNFIGRFIGRAANFFLVPFMLRAIGIADFGLFSLLNVFFYWGSLADLGTGASLARFIAADIAQQDWDALGRRIFGQVLFCCAMTLALAVVLGMIAPLLLSFVRLSVFDAARMEHLVIAFIVFMGMGCVTNVFHSVLLGRQRMDCTNAIAVALVVPNVAGTVYFLRAGIGLEGIVWAFLLTQGIGMLLTFAVMGIVCPELRWAKMPPDAACFAQTVRLGMQMQWMRVTAMLSKTWDQILLAPMIGLTAVTTYSLASKPVLIAQEGGSLILSATVPVVAHLDSHEDDRRLARLLRLSQRAMNIFVAVALAGFWIFADAFVRMWLGPGYGDVTAVMRILAVGHLLPLLTTPGLNELIGKGDMRMVTPILTAQTILQIVLSWLAIKAVGPLGPAVGLVLATGYGTVHFLVAFYRMRAKASSPIRSGQVPVSF